MANTRVNSQIPKPNIDPPLEINKYLSVKKQKTRQGYLIKDLLLFSINLLRSVGITSYNLDSELLLAHVLKISRLELILKRNSEISFYRAKKFLNILKRRLNFEPMAYIQNQKEFFNSNFYVNKNVLIPRPDTEILVELVLNEILSVNSKSCFLDICTGSGAIAISILKERPEATAIALDISNKALIIAKKNAKINNCSDRMKLIKSDLLNNISYNFKTDLIICNPPYIGNSEYNNLMPDVRRHEPKLALKTEDEAGLQFYDRLLKDSILFLNSDGFLVLEIGYKQKDNLMKLLDKNLWKNIKFVKDLANNNRVLVLQKY